MGQIICFETLFVQQIRLLLLSSGPNLVSRAGDLGWTKNQVKVMNCFSLIQDTTKGVDRLRQ